MNPAPPVTRKLRDIANLPFARREVYGRLMRMLAKCASKKAQIAVPASPSEQLRYHADIFSARQRSWALTRQESHIAGGLRLAHGRRCAHEKGLQSRRIA